MIWQSIVVPLGVFLLCPVSVALLLGRRVLKELMQPGRSFEPGSPELGGLILPDVAAVPPEALRRPLHFCALDGTRLSGEFWAQPHQTATMVICHGYRFPSEFFRPMVALGYACGLNILTFDFRGHSQSEQAPITCGVAEAQDLAAAIEVAVRQPETEENRVFLAGFSMGAAVAILLSQHPAVAGIISDSAYARLDEVIYQLVARTLHTETAAWASPAPVRRLLIPVLARLALAGGQVLFFLRYRRSLIARPDRALRKPGRRLPLLLIHDQGDPFTACHHARRLVAAARAAGHSVVEYYTHSSIHCGSYGYDPQRYLELIQHFVSSASS